MLRNMDMDRVIGGVLLLLIHEVDVMSRQGQFLGRSLPPLRDIGDPRALGRWRRQLQRQWGQSRREDRQIRRELWRGLQRDLRGS